MIKSRRKLFSPFFINMKFNMFAIIYILIGLFILFRGDLTTINMSYITLIFNTIILNKLLDVYSTTFREKNKLKNLKKWLDFMKTDTYKYITKSIYVYIISIIINISVCFLIYYITDSLFDKILSTLILCSTIFHILITYLNFKKITI